jgi:Tfp pilus assembly protein PilN
MIKINLLPVEAAEKETKKKFIILGALVAGMLVGLMVFFFFVRVAIERTLAAKASSIQKELQGYKIIVNEVEKLKQITGTLEGRKKIIKTLMRGRLLYPRFMEAFLELLPATVWVNSMLTAKDSDVLKVTFGCTSFDNFGIADFISNLESSPKFEEIELGGVTTGLSGTYEILQFQVICKYLPAVEG